MKTITAAMLLEKNGCIGQVAEFKRLWPDGLTLKSIEEVNALRGNEFILVNLWWFVERFFEGETKAGLDDAFSQASHKNSDRVTECEGCFEQLKLVAIAWLLQNKEVGDANQQASDPERGGEASP